MDEEYAEEYESEHLTASEMNAMALDKLGGALCAAQETIQLLGRARRKQNKLLAVLRVAANNQKHIGDAIALLSTRNRLDTEKAVAENLKIRESAAKDQKSILQSIIKAVG